MACVCMCSFYFFWDMDDEDAERDRGVAALLFSTGMKAWRGFAVVDELLPL